MLTTGVLQLAVAALGAAAAFGYSLQASMLSDLTQALGGQGTSMQGLASGLLSLARMQGLQPAVWQQHRSLLEAELAQAPGASLLACRPCM